MTTFNADRPIVKIKITDEQTGVGTPVYVESHAEAVVCRDGKTVEEKLNAAGGGSDTGSIEESLNTVQEQLVEVQNKLEQNETEHMKVSDYVGEAANGIVQTAWKLATENSSIDSSSLMINSDYVGASATKSVNRANAIAFTLSGADTPLYANRIVKNSKIYSNTTKRFCSVIECMTEEEYNAAIIDTNTVYIIWEE